MSFDRRAVALLAAQGQSARRLRGPDGKPGFRDRGSNDCPAGEFNGKDDASAPQYLTRAK